eukprot:g7867.t1
MEKSPPMATAAGVLATCAVARDPSLAPKSVIILTKKKAKLGRSLEKRHEAAFVDFIENGTPIPDELQKEVRSFDEAQKKEKQDRSSSRSAQHQQKKRRVDPGAGALLLSVVMLVVDVHKAHNSIRIRKSHRKYSRFVVFNPVRKAWDFHESHALTFGNVHSVAAWCINLPKCSKNGFAPKLEKCLRNILALLDQDIRKTSKFEDPHADNVMIYTDASWAHGSGWLAVVVVFCIDGKFVVRRTRVKAADIIKTKRSSPINFLELVTTILAIAELRAELASSFFRISVDNEAARSALLNQNAPSTEMATGAVYFWSFASSRQLTPWVDRVPSGFNIADVPTRPELLQFVQSNFPGVLDDVAEFSSSTMQLLPHVLTLSRSELFGVVEGINLEDMPQDRSNWTLSGHAINPDDLD